MADFIVTKQWLLENQVDRQGWNRRQFQSLGLAWPPRKGSAFVLIGQPIPQKNRLQFEYYKRPDPMQLDMFVN